jgi:hypothetical protein
MSGLSLEEYIYLYNKYKKKYCDLKSSIIISGQTKPFFTSQFNDDDDCPGNAIMQTLIKPKTTVVIPDATKSKISVMVPDDAKSTSISDSILIYFDKYNFGFDRHHKLENYEDIAGDQMPDKIMDSFMFNKEYDRLSIDETKKTLDTLGETCDYHTDLIHTGSSHRTNLYKYVHTYIRNIYNWQEKHYDLYIKNIHPETCIYCEHVGFNNILGIQQTTIDELKYMFFDECAIQCKYESRGAPCVVHS